MPLLGHPKTRLGVREHHFDTPFAAWATAGQTREGGVTAPSAMTPTAAAPELPAPALYVPAEWRPAPPARDVALDLLRGLAMVILVVNHTRLESAIGHLTGSVLSAAEVLVAVSGVVVGMVFGRRWLEAGARATTGMLLRRARKLYLASVVVVALVGLATLVPGLATEALTVSPNVTPAVDSYDLDGWWDTILAILTLEAGPWQFNILGFFIAGITLAPPLLWALARGWWPAVLICSGVLFALGRELQIDVLPSQSERPFPLLVWQVLFVNGIVLGWHRDRIASWLMRRRRAISALVLVLAAAFAGIQVAGPALVDAATWAAWEAEHFDKGSLDLLRVVAMLSIAAALYLAFRRHVDVAEDKLGPVLLPLGRNSFYVFIVHVFLCLGLASVPALRDADGLGLIGNTLVQLGCLGLLCMMVRRRFLFRWIPR